MAQRVLPGKPPLIPRAALAIAPDGSGYDLLVRTAPGRPWRTLRHWAPDDHGHAVGFSQDGRTLYAVASYSADTMRLLALGVATGAETVLAADPQSDVDDDPWYYRSGVLLHPTARTVQAVGFYRERLKWHVLDAGVTADFEALARLGPGELSIVGRDAADRTWLVASTADVNPARYYVYHRGTRSAALLFGGWPALEGRPLAKKQPVAFTARDGLAIHGYLTLPPGVTPRDLPAVLLVHGGPHTRDRWGFGPEAQWLANRGYAVLQVNYRGSTGYGKAFRNAGYREWGGKMHDDLVDGVGWLVAQGIADPRRIGIMGFSYGGYATLVGMTFTPDVFAAGVALCGPSNLSTHLRSGPTYWQAQSALDKATVGDPDTEEDFLQSRSPLFFADRIAAPLFIAQGANDPKVRQAESDQIVAAARRAGKPVEYVVYADEGHGLVRPENRLHFYARVEAFLARHLGGRCEPPGELGGHSGADK